ALHAGVIGLHRVWPDGGTGRRKALISQHVITIRSTAVPTLELSEPRHEWSEGGMRFRSWLRAVAAVGVGAGVLSYSPSAAADPFAAGSLIIPMDTDYQD